MSEGGGVGTEALTQSAHAETNQISCYLFINSSLNSAVCATETGAQIETCQFAFVSADETAQYTCVFIVEPQDFLADSWNRLRHR